jgi:predicted ATPase/DNA-binding winged helix-turn-helix (wHTH) protein
VRISNEVGDTSIRGARERAVLAYLMSRRGRSTSPDEIVAALWGDEAGVVGAVRSLRVRIANLRKVLEPFGKGIDSSRAGYRLTVDADRIDLARFELTLQRADALDPVAAIPHLEQALDGWRAAPLQEFAYNDWAQPFCNHLDELRATAIDRLGEALTMGGRETEGIRVLSEAHQRSPERESTCRLLMTAMQAAGRPSEGLAVFRRTSEALADRGLMPAAETRAVENELLAGKPPKPRPTNLPHTATLIGRTDELEALVSMVDEHRLVTTIGPGGVGKTRLAIETGHRMRDRFPGGVSLLDLSGVDDPSLVDAAVARGLQVRPETGRTIRDTLIEALTGQPALIILDNCEHLIGAVAGLAKSLVEGVEDLHILATSRSPLEIPMEYRCSVGPLPIPGHDDEPDEVLASDSVRLFLDRARAIGAGPAIATEVAALARLVRSLDGLPLALELAAARSRALSPSQIADRLDQRFELLEASGGGMSPRHRTIEATLDWSYELLEPASATVLRRLGVFRGGFTLEAAETVCTAADLPAHAVAPALARLVDHSLLQVNDGPHGRRFEMLESVRLYTRRLLDTAGESRQVGERHVTWIVELAEALAEDRSEAAVLTRFDRLDTEIDNIRQAFGLACGVPLPDYATRLAATTYPFWYRRGYWAEGRAWLNRAVDHAFSEAVPPAAARALTGAASLSLYSEGDVERAETLWRRELDLSERYDIRRPYNNLSMVYSFAGRWEEAAELLEQAVDQQRAAGEEAWLELANLGGAMVALGRLDEARRILAESEDDARHRGFENTNHAVHAMAEMAIIDGDLAQARELAAAGLKRWEEAGISFEHQMSLRHVLVRIALLEGDTEQAGAILRDTGERMTSLGGPLVEHVVVWAAYALAVGEPLLAASLLGTAAARTPARRALPVAIGALRDEVEAALKETLGDDYEREWLRGHAEPPAAALTGARSI